MEQMGRFRRAGFLVPAVSLLLILVGAVSVFFALSSSEPGKIEGASACFSGNGEGVRLTLNRFTDYSAFQKAVPPEEKLPMGTGEQEAEKAQRGEHAFLLGVLTVPNTVLTENGRLELRLFRQSGRAFTVRTIFGTVRKGSDTGHSERLTFYDYDYPDGQGDRYERAELVAGGQTVAIISLKEA